MEFSICKLKPKSSFHLGERENFLEGTDVIIHSDTLFSAFCNGYLLLYGKTKLEELLQRFLTNNPPFLISSAFPFWKSKLYFPIPYNQIPKEKKIKKILFIEKEGFEKLLDGEKIEEVAENFKTIPDINAKEEEKRTPWQIITTPRVGLSRLNNHPGDRYFHFGEVFYKENSGLFFLLDFKDDSLKKEFDAVFRLLGDEGIGGDRTVGKGFYEPEFGQININLPDCESVITLSLYSPSESELFDIKDGYYEIIERKGYIYSPYNQSLRRKSIRMFKEGSVFKTKKKGRIVDITPEIFNFHKIYRYGLCCALPCRLEVKE